MTVQLSGWVLDNLKNPVVGATVSAYAATSPGMPGGASLYSTSTDASGHWTVTGMVTQLYDVNVDKAGSGFWEKGLSDWNINTLTVGGTSAPAAGALQVIAGGMQVTGQVTLNGNTVINGANQIVLTLKAGNAGVPFASAISFSHQDGTQLWQAGSSVVSGLAQRFEILDVLRSAAPLSIDGTGLVTLSVLGVTGNVGFFSHAPVAIQGTSAAATDLTTVLALANSIRTALVNYGLTV